VLGHSSDTAMFTTMTDTTLSILQSLLDKSIRYKRNFIRPIVITKNDLVKDCQSY